tara:strand:+ start:40 stop:441 length:402 start_codon:yes stop_codon:yes gene_type:complete
MKESTFKKYCLVVDEWLVNGFNGTQAYLKFYPDVSAKIASVECSRILAIPCVDDYKESKQSITSDKLQITLERQVLELERLKGLSEDSEKFNDAISALKEQSKLLGLYEEHNSQKKLEISTPPTIVFIDTDED